MNPELMAFQKKLDAYQVLFQQFAAFGPHPG